MRLSLAILGIFTALFVGSASDAVAKNVCSSSSPCSFSIGSRRICAVVEGAAYCSIDGAAPAVVPGLASGVTAISVGRSHACAIVRGAAVCWGSNDQGQLGVGDLVLRRNPTQVIGLTRGVTAISSSAHHTCAVVNGGAKCWGYNLDGEIGNERYGVKFTVPEDVQDLKWGVTSIVTGREHTCALQSGAVRCWGFGIRNELGKMLYGKPATIPDLQAEVTAISAHAYTTCAIKRGALYCVGDPISGGDGMSNYVRTEPIKDFDRAVTNLAVGSGMVCATLKGAVICHIPGGNRSFNGSGARDAYVYSPPRMDNITSLAVGDDSGCLTLKSKALCWGEGFLPVPVTGLGELK